MAILDFEQIVGTKFGTVIMDTKRLDKSFSIFSPSGDRNKHLRALLFDSWFDQYRGVICLLAIVEGEIKKGIHIFSLSVNWLLLFETISLLSREKILSFYWWSTKHYRYEYNIFHSRLKYLLVCY